MSFRLFWNFEMTNTHLLNWNDLKAEPEEIRWEARYFWPQEAIIHLEGLDKRFLNLAEYKIKQRNDRYTLLADSNFNIKQRRGQLFYKPLLAERDGLQGYGKKVNLNECLPQLKLAGSKTLRAIDLHKQLENNSQEIEV